jgi:pyruvate,water dikinase
MLKKIKLLKNWKVGKGTSRENEAGRLFRFKYAAFRMLLDSNTKLLQIISDLEEKLRGQQVFGMSYVRAEAGWALFHCLRMVKSLDDLSHHRYPRLFEVVKRIEGKIQEEMGRKKEPGPAELILTYDRINREMIDWVGGKNANLGEMRSRLRLPIPEGFCITIGGFTTFLSHNELLEKINARKMEIEPGRPETIAESSREIQRLISSAEVPEEMEAAIKGAYDEMLGRINAGKIKVGSLRVSVRSSATREDSTLTFAGQYLSVLNVPGDGLITAYKEVIASLYTPAAIAYRLNKGIMDEDIAMSIACLEMIGSVASGVIYTRHPFNFLEDNIFITAVWGLGPYAVEGRVTPDSYVL